MVYFIYKILLEYKLLKFLCLMKKKKKKKRIPQTCMKFNFIEKIFCF